MSWSPALKWPNQTVKDCPPVDAPLSRLKSWGSHLHPQIPDTTHCHSPEPSSLRQTPSSTRSVSATRGQRAAQPDRRVCYRCPLSWSMPRKETLKPLWWWLKVLWGRLGWQLCRLKSPRPCKDGLCWSWFLRSLGCQWITMLHLTAPLFRLS